LYLAYSQTNPYCKLILFQILLIHLDSTSIIRRLSRHPNRGPLVCDPRGCHCSSVTTVRAGHCQWIGLWIAGSGLGLIQQRYFASFEGSKLMKFPHRFPSLGEKVTSWLGFLRFPWHHEISYFGSSVTSWCSSSGQERSREFQCQTPGIPSFR